ncbi:SDR family NAD(P)-dependent oxidoreductase [Rhodococcoides yunnanense]|uniref:SDR family NAD(P)-dependent oxidoreductase n=1 Tax=Rhodococcoides yunnanense TaxID=278209 RepID=UPI000934E8CF|nr:SDR family NAD(P)-dependent oxidoreductase [Rhodococcus yunnanensis]
MSYPTNTPATWYVTGTSRGLGLELVKKLLARGENVTATTRSPGRLAEALGDVDTQRLLALNVDLNDQDSVSDSVARTVDRFGRLDVVVNNAGYGLIGSVEDTSEAESRAMFDVNVFGVWNVLRATLPILRSQGSGHIMNVSSVFGLVAGPGWGLYNATKFALEGLSDALAQEVASLGIKVSLIEPGYFRTDFLNTDSLATPSALNDAYAPIKETLETHLALHGGQLGDPAKGADAIVEIAVAGDGPLHQLLGSDSYAYATAKLESLRNDFEAGRDLAYSTDHAE